MPFKDQFVTALVLLVVAACKTGFVEEDIEKLKGTVKTEFEKQPGVTVSEVTFIKESDKKLTGFAKLKIADQEVTKSCEATMGENAQYVWKCE